MTATFVGNIYSKIRTHKASNNHRYQFMVLIIQLIKCPYNTMTVFDSLVLWRMQTELQEYCVQGMRAFKRKPSYITYVDVLIEHVDFYCSRTIHTKQRRTVHGPCSRPQMLEINTLPMLTAQSTQPVFTGRVYAAQRPPTSIPSGTWHLDASSRLATIEMNRKLGKGAPPPFGEGCWVPIYQRRLG